MLGTYFDPTNQCRRVSSAPSLLPEPIYWQRFDAFHSNLPSISNAPQPGLAPTKSPPSIFRVRVFLPTSSSRPGPLQKHLLHVFRANVSRGHLMPHSRVSHTTAPGGPLTCLHVWTSRACLCKASFCSSGHFPIHTPSDQYWVARLERSPPPQDQKPP